jgi:hypothetical protein
MDLQTFNAAYQRAKAYQSSENCFHQGNLFSYEQLYGEHQMCGVVHLLTFPLCCFDQISC